MDGILLPVAGLVVSLCLGLTSFVIPRLRRFTLAALTAPFLTSVALLIGGFILADMNPAREYGAAYVPNGREHDPTKLDFCSAVLVSRIHICHQCVRGVSRPEVRNRAITARRNTP
jgi:hypothetical protein